jgi:hypothetical protein
VGRWEGLGCRGRVPSTVVRQEGAAGVQEVQTVGAAWRLASGGEQGDQDDWMEWVSMDKVLAAGMEEVGVEERGLARNKRQASKGG